MKLLAAIIVVGFGLFLIGVAILSFARPALVARFFMAFASSARTHFAEQAVRLLVGASLVLLAPVMWKPGLFGFGVLLPGGVLRGHRGGA